MKEKKATFKQDHRVRVAPDTHVYFKKGESYRIDHIYVADIDNETMIAIHRPGYSPICVEAHRLTIEESDQKHDASKFYF